MLCSYFVKSYLDLKKGIHMVHYWVDLIIIALQQTIVVCDICRCNRTNNGSRKCRKLLVILSLSGTLGISTFNTLSLLDTALIFFISVPCFFCNTFSWALLPFVSQRRLWMPVSIFHSISFCSSTEIAFTLFFPVF